MEGDQKKKPNPLFAGFIQGCVEAFNGSVLDWLREHVTLPHSARSTAFDPELAPWLNPIIEAIFDDRVKLIFVRAPTGGAKTTLMEVCIPACIKLAPGPTLLAGQTNNTTKEWMESRMLPVLKACKPVAAILDFMDRHAIRKNAILFPGLPFFFGGANETNLQEKSMRYCWGDEVWQWTRGMIRELIARHHDRWNRKTILCSQGWETSEDPDHAHEAEEYWNSGTQEKRGFTCPYCNQWQLWLWDQMIYDEAKDSRGNWDANALARSARYRCKNEACAHEFEDTTANRRMLSGVSAYEVSNPNAKEGWRSFEYPAYSVWWISWGELVCEWVAAQEEKKRGNLVPLIQFVQKRKAQVWVDEIKSDVGALIGGGYSKSDFADGQIWAGELHRFAMIDKQLDHFWMVVRAFMQDGTSRLLFEGKVLTVEGCRDVQLRYKVQDPKTFEDARYRPTEVYRDCAKFGWTAVLGTGEAGFKHIPRKGKPVVRYYSPITTIDTGDGLCRRILFSNEKVKDLLHTLRSGHGPRWDVPDDISEDYIYQIDSEMKRDVVNKVTKAVVQRWVKFRPNHLYDCEVGCALGANIFRLIGGVDTPEEDGKPVVIPQVQQLEEGEIYVDTSADS